MSAATPKPFGAYVLLKALGQGAMGDVQLSRPFNPNRGIPTPLVIKRLHGELANDEDFVRRFKHEANIAVSVDSPYVAKVYDVGCVDETLYIAMEFVPGWPLSKFLEAVIHSGRHASIASVVDMIAGGLEGLQALHNAKDVETGKPLGIVHRDISPKNLMVGDDGKMRLIDLGLGKSNLQDWKTRTGIVMGSVGYMPPEQVTAETVDHRADLYAMGVVLYESIALRNFVRRGPIPQMLRASLRPEWKPLSEIRPDIPKGLDDFIKKACAPEPEDRFDSAEAFLKALKKIVPADKTVGGTAALIRELFGDAERERRQEIGYLLSLPLPEPEDGPEMERTIVFVQHKDVAPLQQEDFLPTHAGMATVPAQYMPEMNQPYMMGAQPYYPMDPASITGPDGAPVSPYQTHTLAVKSGISTGTLIAAMAGTASLTAALILGGMKLLDDTPSADPYAKPQQALTPPPKPQPLGVETNQSPTAVQAKPPAPHEEPVPETKTKRPRTKTKRPSHELAANEPNPPARETPPKEAKPKPAAIEPTSEGVQAAAQAIINRVQSYRKAHPERNSELLGILTAASQEKNNPNYESAAKNLAKLRRRLNEMADK